MRRQGVVAILVIVLAVFIVAPAVSFGLSMSQPSSVPVSVRSVEWLRANGGAWLVNAVERAYYSWTAPTRGGPGLAALPTVVADSVASQGTPAPVKPAIAPALSGEGVWKPAGRLVNGRPALWVTEFRNERDYPRIVTYAALIDPAQTQLSLYPGRVEPPQGSPRGPMMVPHGQRLRLLATFNSGFRYQDGHGGLAVNGCDYEPFSAGMGTLVGYADGRVDIVGWPGGRPGPEIAFARQNLPLIVDGGKANPTLSTSGAQWGQTLGNAIRVWRSGIGIDTRGDLIYVAAPSQTVMSLASALIGAGAVRAIQFDINVYWPTFNYYRLPGAGAPVKFLPNAQHPGITRYLTPDDRDFFAVYSREKSGSFNVPFR